MVELKASPATFDNNCGTDEWEFYCNVAEFNREGPGKGTYKITADVMYTTKLWIYPTQWE